ncbi:MAG: hypothetical protein M5U30_18265 [Burkholderiaceae bacterium]|nr:hypothetical protein [Burkholderiaceae bacterium]
MNSTGTGLVAARRSASARMPSPGSEREHALDPGWVVEPQVQPRAEAHLQHAAARPGHHQRARARQRR